MHYSRWQRTGNPLGARDKNNLAKDRVCKVPGCDRVQGTKGGRGLCPKHYLRWLNTGDPEGTLRRSAEERFWEKVSVRGPNDCWQWLAFRNPDGYGMFGSTRAHRWVYENCVEPIPNGLVIDHLCRDRGCVNPSHLEAVTNQENLERGWGRRIKNGMTNQCINGHELTSENVYMHPRGSKVCRVCRAKSQRKHEMKKKRMAA